MADLFGINQSTRAQRRIQKRSFGRAEGSKCVNEQHVNNMYGYVCMYACMYVCMYVCISYVIQVMSNATIS